MRFLGQLESLSTSTNVSRGCYWSRLVWNFRTRPTKLRASEPQRPKQNHVPWTHRHRHRLLPPFPSSLLHLSGSPPFDSISHCRTEETHPFTRSVGFLRGLGVRRRCLRLNFCRPQSVCHAIPPDRLSSAQAIIHTSVSLFFPCTRSCSCFPSSADRRGAARVWRKKEKGRGEERART